MKKLVFLTGAGISAESGIKTFRDADGLWEGHDIMEVATPQGWRKNKELVLDFYNKRRKQLLEVKPNKAHEVITELSNYYNVKVITQNVDNLHEKAGNKHVLHLHGELTKVRSTIDDKYIIEWEKDLHLGDNCPKGGQLRPHIVWFGEDVPKLVEAISIIEEADFLVVVGTSLVVYPAAGLIDYKPYRTPIIYIDPKPDKTHPIFRNKNIVLIEKKATKGMMQLREILNEMG